MAEKNPQIVIQITTGISLWTAIKLRIAGKIIDEISREILVKIGSKEEVKWQ